MRERKRQQTVGPRVLFQPEEEETTKKSFEIRTHLLTYMQSVNCMNRNASHPTRENITHACIHN